MQEADDPEAVLVEDEWRAVLRAVGRHPLGLRMGAAMTVRHGRARSSNHSRGDLLHEPPDRRTTAAAGSSAVVADLHHIVVVGGGAGGLELVTRLGDKLGQRRKAEVTLVDRARTHLWKPLLHEVAAGSMDLDDHALDYLAQAHWHPSATASAR